MASTSVAVDVALDDAEEHKIRHHDHECDEPCDSGDHRGEDRSAETSTECEEEGDECEAASNRVEDHDAGKRLRGISRSGGEGGVIDFAHDVGRVVANVLWEAQILVGSVWQEIVS